MEMAVVPVTKLPDERKAKKLPPAAKIGTRRPAD
jgi:hypothetical protein